MLLQENDGGEGTYLYHEDFGLHVTHWYWWFLGVVFCPVEYKETCYEYVGITSREGYDDIE